MDANKPLKDWTAEEIYEECKEHWSKYGAACPKCYFFDPDTAGCLVFNRIPFRWDLNGPSRFTKQERDDAKTPLKCVGNARIWRSDTGGLWLFKDDEKIRLRQDIFITVGPGETVKLSEIAGREK
jgi:hypothetical protein